MALQERTLYHSSDQLATQPYRLVPVSQAVGARPVAVGLSSVSEAQLGLRSLLVTACASDELGCSDLISKGGRIPALGRLMQRILGLGQTWTTENLSQKSAP